MHPTIKLQEFLQLYIFEAWQRGATPCLRLGAAAEIARLQQLRSSLEELPLPEARGSTWEEQPHVQGAVAAWAQQGLEELFQVQGQEGCR